MTTHPSKAHPSKVQGKREYKETLPKEKKTKANNPQK
jgi:hypothetical protein